MTQGDYALIGGRLVLPDSILEGASVIVQDGLIEAILERGTGLPAHLPVYDAEGAWVTPGLLELHIHGAGGVGFDDLGSDLASSAASILRARDFLRTRGVTCFVPTLVCREAQISALAEALETAALPETEIPGIYVEGPFISSSKRGGIPDDTISSADPKVLDRLLGIALGRLRMMTIAPEVPGAEEIMEALTSKGILVCLGHSNCSLESAPLPRGDYSITHLFNAMSPFSHKEAGLAMLPFIDHRPYVELNADGVHVGETALRAAALSLDPERIMLISDAVVAAGLPHGEYSYYGMRIVSGSDGVRYADTGILMGSNRLAPDVLRNWLRVTGTSIQRAVRALSLTPARALGLADRRGAIRVGLAADLVVWEGDFDSVRRIFGRGQPE
ncbi:MAG: amidohydrolase family protein [Spirochaetota bacterium]